MSQQKVQKVIYYKRATFKEGSLHLQDCLASGLSKCSKPAARVEKLNDEGSVCRLINSYKTQEGMLCGQIIQFEPGRDQTVIVLDDDRDEYPVEQFELPKKNGKNQEVVESVLYFAILENHLVVAQSQALKSRELEYHLNWLLKEHTNTIDDTEIVILSDRPTKKTEKQVRQGGIKKVSFGTPVTTQPKQEEPQDEVLKMGTPKRVRFTPYGKGADILKAIMGDVWFNDLELKEALDDANLRLSIELTYLRKTTKVAKQILSEVSQAMRHAEPEDVRIEMENGAVLKGDDLKLSGKVSVDAVNGVVIAKDLYFEMRKWLETYIQDGKVN